MNYSGHPGSQWDWIRSPDPLCSPLFSMSAVTPTQFDTFHMWPCVSLFAQLLAPEDSGYLLFYFQPAPESVRHKLSDSAKWNVDNLILDT